MADNIRDFRSSFADLSLDDISVVAAIDFGTTYSGYAFSTKTNPERVYVHAKWGEVMAIPHSFKTPTCILTDRNLRFIALGYDAISQFNSMGSDEAEGFRFFAGFKMKLHTDKAGFISIFR